MNNPKAKHLRISVYKSGIRTVDLTFPAHCCRWIVDIIPNDLVTKIRSRGIKIDEIQHRLSNQVILSPCAIFQLEDIDEHKRIAVWLE